jgi:mono/diheme cytochrome c family protein
MLMGAVSAYMLTSICSAAPSEADVAYFEEHIRPLLAQHCYQCHSIRANKRKGGLGLDSRSARARGGESGPAVVPGDPDASLLIRAVRYQDPELQMPPGGRLPAEAIARLERWVQSGAVDPGEAQVTESDRKDHWAYQPLSQSPLPAVQRTDWARGAIDHFVFERLEQADLRLAPDAEPRHLVRRIYFQLTGLPPSREQVEAYLGEERPDALARLVDQLLTSPRFGERWGRHWLDLARYADSNGLDENFLFREAWRYRNWVIDALNDDTPFDRFLLEQLAGDLLSFETIEQRDRQRIAAGFLVVGPKVLLGNDKQNQRMEIADEQIDTIGRAILGQTLGCARCHDHKFDPVPTADYYALAGILTSTQVMQRRHMLGQQRVMERLVGLGANGDVVNEAYEAFWRQRPALKKKIDKAKAALELLKKEDEAALQAHLKDSAESVAAVAKDMAATRESRINAQEALVAKLAALLANPPKIPPRAMIPTDVEAPKDEHIRVAGRFDQLGDPTPRGFLQVLVRDETAAIPAQQSGRVELSHWLTDVHHGAGRLAARVLANRIWHHLIGQGLVRTADNFGHTGEAPSHLELLDYLAKELIDSGWSIKSLVRQIVLSRTFVMSSDYDEQGDAVDPDNRLLWRANRRRLDPESLRDAMLAAAGQLDLTPMDSTVWYLEDQATAVGKNEVRRRTDFNCRSVYLPVIRNDLPELFEVFDFADAHATTGARPQTTVATQALYVLNAEMVMEAAEAIVRRLLTSSSAAEDRAGMMFEWVLNVPATDIEREELLDFIHQTENRLAAEGDEDASLRAWTLGCHALFAISRFQFLE